MPATPSYHVSTASQYMGRSHLVKSPETRRSSETRSGHFSNTDTIITTPSGTNSIDFAFANNASSTNTSSERDSCSPRSAQSHDSLTVAKLEGRTPSRQGVSLAEVEEEAPTAAQEFSFAAEPEVMTVAPPLTTSFFGPDVPLVLSPTTYSPSRPPARGKDVDYPIASSVFSGEGSKYPRLQSASHSPTTSSPNRPTTRGKAPQTSLLLPSCSSFTAAGTQYPALPPISHLPSSSAVSDVIYFSPIGTTGRDTQMFLSSPQPSPPRMPDESAEEVVTGDEIAPPVGTEEREEEAVAVKAALLKISKEISHEVSAKADESKGNDAVAKTSEAGQAADADIIPSAATILKPREMIEVLSTGRYVQGEKIMLTLKQVDKLAVALATSSIVQEAVCSKALPQNESVLPFPISKDGAGGVAIVGSNGRITATSSHEALETRKPVPEPHRETATASLHVFPSAHVSGESKILLQAHMPLVCASGRPRALLTETDLTTSFTSAVLHELAASVDLRLDDIEIATPVATQSPESAIDWCALADEFQAHERLGDAIDLCLRRLKCMDGETCTMQTLTLLSELGRVRRSMSDALVVKLTSDGFSVPFISQALNDKLKTTEARAKFIDAVLVHVGPQFKSGEEFKVLAELSKNKKTVSLRCVPVTREASPEARVDWVCFVGREFF